METSGVDVGDLMFQARVDLTKIESDLKAIQTKFDQKPISLKLKVDDGSLRDIVNKVQTAVQSAVSGRNYISTGGSPITSSIANAITNNIGSTTQAAPITPNVLRDVGAFTAQGNICPNCGAVNSPGASYCPRCGYKRNILAKAGIGAWNNVVGPALETVGKLPFNIIGKAAHILAAGAEGAAISGVQTMIGGVAKAAVQLPYYGAKWAINKTIDTLAGNREPATIDDLIVHNTLNFQDLTNTIQGLGGYSGPSADDIGMSVYESMKDLGFGRQSRRRRKPKRKPRGGGGGTSIGGAFDLLKSGSDPYEVSPAHWASDEAYNKFKAVKDNLESWMPQEEISSTAEGKQGLADAIRKLDALREVTGNDLIGEHEEIGPEEDYRQQMAKPNRQAKLRRFRKNRRGGYVNFGGAVDALSGLASIPSRMSVGGIIGTFAFGVDLGINSTSEGNSYLQSMAGGDPYQQLAAQARYENSSPVPLIGGAISGLRESIFGLDRKAVATNAEAAYNNSTRFNASQSSRQIIGIQASIAGMSDSLASQNRSIDLTTEGERLGGQEYYSGRRSQAQARALGLQNEIDALSNKGIFGNGTTFGIGSGNRAEQTEKRRLMQSANQDAVDAMQAENSYGKALASQNAATKAKVARNYNADAIASNARVLGSQGNELGAIYANYGSAIARTDDGAMQGRLRNERDASVGAYDFNTRMGFMNNAVATQNNNAAQIGLTGNSIGATLAGLNAQRLASYAQGQSEIRGINPLQSPGRFLSVIGAAAARDKNLDIQQQLAIKGYGLDLSDLNYQIQGGQAGLMHDSLGAAKASIEGRRARAKASMPSGQFARYSQVLDIEGRQAEIQSGNTLRGYGIDTNLLNSSTSSIELSNANQLHAGQSEQIRGEIASAIARVQADDIPDDLKMQRIDAIKKQGVARLGSVTRSLGLMANGGLAASLGNSINYAEQSSIRGPVEDLGAARLKVDQDSKALQKDADAVKSAIKSDTAKNKKLTGDQDANKGNLIDMDQKDLANLNTQATEMVRYLAKIADTIGSALTAQ